MDNPNLTMEEYIRLKEERAQRSGETFDWQNAKFGRTKHYYVDECFANFKAEFPAIVLEQPQGNTKKMRMILNSNSQPSLLETLLKKTTVSYLDHR
ncbi:hypothetical protein Tco_0262948, partial [Tanacetum coccineum]